MVYFADINLEIISSVPGRIRVNVDFLLRKRTGSMILNSLKSINGIISTAFNKRTRNILIFYRYKEIDEIQLLDKIRAIDNKDIKKDIENDIPKKVNKDSITKIIFKTLNPINLIKKKYPMKAYKDNYSLSKRIIKVGLFFGVIVFALTFNLSNIISILILSYPGILFTISSIANFYSAKKAYLNGIYLKNNHFIRVLSETDTLFVEDNLLIKERNIFNTILNKLNKNIILRFTALRKLENPIDSEFEKVIYKLREYGITDIIVFSDNNKEILDYIAYSLGIDKTYFLKDNILLFKNLKKEENLTAIVSENSIEKIRKLNLDLVICIKLNNEGNIFKGDINFVDKNIKKLPWLLDLSKYNEEVIIRSQTIATGLNALGIFISVITNINPLLSFGIYGLNILAQTIGIKYSIETR